MEIVEGDELFTFIGNKENQCYVMTWVERKTRCIVGHAVVMNRSEEVLREMIWQKMPSAKQYYNDAFVLYDTIGYPGAHQSLPNKEQTYSAEADNAELRHCREIASGDFLDLARLARKSRCFSRRIEALSRAVDLFVWAWNKRQRAHRQFPKFRRSLTDFITKI